MAEIRLVLVKTPKAVVVLWGCGSQAHITALGIPYGSVGMSGKATWERERRNSGHAVVPRLCAAGWSRRSESSAGVCSPSPNLVLPVLAGIRGEGAAQPLEKRFKSRVGLFSGSQASRSKSLIKVTLVRFTFAPSNDFDKESCWGPLAPCGGCG